MQKGEFFVSPIEAADTEPTPPHREAAVPFVNPMKQAFILKQLLEQGTCATQADVARHLGMSRARVTQILNLLKLTPEIRDTLLTLSDEQLCLISERRLRPIARIMSPTKQEKTFKRLCKQVLPGNFFTS